MCITICHLRLQLKNGTNTKEEEALVIKEENVDTMSASRFKFSTSPKVHEIKRKVILKNADKYTQWALKLSCIWQVWHFCKLLNILYIPWLQGVYGEYINQSIWKFSALG